MRALDYRSYGRRIASALAIGMGLIGVLFGLFLDWRLVLLEAAVLIPLTLFLRTRLRP